MTYPRESPEEISKQEYRFGPFVSCDQCKSDVRLKFTCGTIYNPKLNFCGNTCRSDWIKESAHEYEDDICKG